MEGEDCICAEDKNMKKIPQYKQAIESLYGHTLFSNEEIKKMPIDQLKFFLKEDGLDIQKLTAKMQKQKEQWAGSKSFREACDDIRGATPGAEDIDLAGIADDKIEAALLAHYGSLEAIPLAARGFKGLGRIEKESMYRDLILKGKRRA